MVVVMVVMEEEEEVVVVVAVRDTREASFLAKTCPKARLDPSLARLHMTGLSGHLSSTIICCEMQAMDMLGEEGMAEMEAVLKAFEEGNEQDIEELMPRGVLNSTPQQLKEVNRELYDQMEDA